MAEREGFEPGDGQVAHDEISFLSYLEGAASDLAALVAFDTDEDGWLDSDDAEFSKFKVWNDADSDGVVDTGELQTLGQHDIARLRLTPTPDSGKELAHVKVVATSIYELTDGTEHLLGDVAFSIAEQTPPDII